MPIVDPAGSHKYWLDGVVFEGLQKAASPPDTGPRKYWLNGTAVAFVLAAAGGSSVLSTVGTSAGTSTVSGVGVGINRTTGTSAGTSTVAGVGGAVKSTVGTSAGAATVLGVGGVAVTVRATVGTAAGTSTVLGVTNGAVTRGTIQGTSTVLGVGDPTRKTVGTSAGTSVVTGVGRPLSGTIGHIVGTSTVTGVGVRKKVAIGANAFTYLPLDTTVAQFAPRRRPMVRIQDSLNDAPNTIAFTSGVIVLPGQNLTVDFDDGVGERFNGEVQRVDFTYEENNDQLIWNVMGVDYIFQLNKKRPFGNWEDTSITTIIEEMFAAYAPGFTTTGLQSSLPAITVIFDGSMTFSSCLSFLAKMALAKWRLNDYDLQFYTTSPGPNPADVTSSNMDLLRTQAITYTEDISQVRNRVFGKGASAQAVSDTPPGSEALQVEGLDLFSDTGGQAYTSGMVLNYTGRSTVYIPVDRGTAAGAPSAHAVWVPSEPDAYYDAWTYPNIHFSSIHWHRGGMKGIAKYYVSYVRDGLGESPLSPASASITHLNYQPESITFHSVGGGSFTASHVIENEVLVGAGGVPAGFMMYRIGLRYSYGTVTVIPGTAFFEQEVTSPGPSGNAVRFSNLPVSGNPDLNGIVFWRRRADGTYCEVGTASNGSSEFVDRLPDAALGTPFPDDPMFPFQGLTAGIEVEVRVPVSTDPTVRSRKVYRAEGQHLTITTEPLELTTLNDNVTDVYIDSSSLKLAGRAAPKEPAPIVRYYLVGIPTSGVGSITKWVRQGADVHLYVMREDLAQQLLLAQREGGDGVREHDVPDTRGMTTIAEMIRRLDAELVLFAPPIKSVAYSTRDRDTRVGSTVVWNLLHPPITGTFKVESVTIEEMHETTDNIGLKERRNVVASTAGRFTLSDLLRKAVIAP